MAFTVGENEVTEIVGTYTLISLPFPGSPSQLMTNFQFIYEEMFFARYRDILHPDFKTVLQQETIDQFPDVGEFLELDEELRIHERMFSGQDLTGPNGNRVPGVIDISFAKFQPEWDWQVSPADDPIPNALFAPYDVELLFNRGQDNSQISVKGQIRFYVTSKDSLHEGTTKQYYQMVGQVDLTDIQNATEVKAWGSAKAIYR